MKDKIAVTFEYGSATPGLHNDRMYYLAKISGAATVEVTDKDNKKKIFRIGDRLTEKEVKEIEYDHYITVVPLKPQ